jgi:hypothetical protein
MSAKGGLIVAATATMVDVQLPDRPSSCLVMIVNAMTGYKAEFTA